MTEQGMPNSVELYEGAVGYMGPVIAGVKSGQLNNPTPCSEWNVQVLIAHSINPAKFVYGSIMGTGEALSQDRNDQVQ